MDRIPLTPPVKLTGHSTDMARRRWPMPVKARLLDLWARGRADAVPGGGSSAAWLDALRQTLHRCCSEHSGSRDTWSGETLSLSVGACPLVQCHETERGGVDSGDSC
jgi:hypothetical protein